jgi:hypothetical protein
MEHGDIFFGIEISLMYHLSSETTSDPSLHFARRFIYQQRSHDNLTVSPEPLGIELLQNMAQIVATDLFPFTAINHSNK